MASCTKVAQNIPGDSCLVIQAEAVLLLVPDLPGDLSMLHKTSKDEISFPSHSPLGQEPLGIHKGPHLPDATANQF